jgi:hypothetical protein
MNKGNELKNTTIDIGGYTYEIDSDGDLEIEIECYCDCTVTRYINIEELIMEIEQKKIAPRDEGQE